MSSQRQPKAVVLYDTVFGNTEKVASALARGLRRYCEVDFQAITEADPARLSGYDLIAVGAPTQGFTAHRPMKDFLSRLESKGLEGRLGFAFDTKIDSRLSGSAAKFIEERLGKLGLKMARPRASAIVSGGTKDNVLREGEEARFEQIGAEMGAALAATGGRAGGAKAPVSL
ncbi:MAG TPA: flavodoxin domain-containing protein [Nitrososphaerales archaeon]|nr:flavodoxin domain-containing protein [Nitrososphaerales archaeon]